MRWLILPLIVASLLWTSTTASSPKSGHWWRTLSSDFRLGYVTGLLDGVSGFADLGRVDPQQLAVGLDHFYADPANRSIDSASAAWVVVDAMHGRSAAERAPVVEALRRGAR